MDLGLTGRRAAVAASSAGLGFHAARALGREGARVAISGRDDARRAAALAALRAEGIDAVAVAADVSTPAGAEAFVGSCIDELGGVDILIANAGGPPPGTFATTTLDAYRQALDLNLLSTVAMCKQAVPGMQEARWGRVVAITSIAVRQPIASLMASTTARAGVTGFLKVLATEVAADGVTVNSLQPGVHATDRLASMPPAALAALMADVPVGALGDPAAFGSAVAFLCSVHAGFITGTCLPVDGGAARGLL